MSLKQDITHSRFQFMWHTSRIQIILTFLFIIGGIIFFYIRQTQFTIDLYIVSATFIIALFIWYNEKNQDWGNYLPKKLNIYYIENEMEHASIINAPLNGESDIRNWGLSIGQTILNKGNRINFIGFKTTGPQLQKERRIQLYNLYIYLSSAITYLPEITTYEFSDDGKIKTV